MCVNYLRLPKFFECWNSAYRRILRIILYRTQRNNSGYAITVNVLEQETAQGFHYNYMYMNMKIILF